MALDVDWQNNVYKRRHRKSGWAARHVPHRLTERIIAPNFSSIRTCYNNRP